MRSRWLRTLAFGLVLAGWGTCSPAEAETVLKAITYAPLSKVEDSMVIFKKWVEKVNTPGRGDLKIELLGGPEVFSVSDQMNALSKGLVDVVMTFSVHTPLVPEVDTSGLSDITPAEERKNGYLELLDYQQARQLQGRYVPCRRRRWDKAPACTTPRSSAP